LHHELAGLRLPLSLEPRTRDGRGGGAGADGEGLGARNDRPSRRAQMGGVRAGRCLVDFGGMHIAVTGASSGIGLATAELLAGRGARGSLIARRKAALDEVAGEVGANAAGYAADVGRKDQLDAALEAAAAHFAPVEGLFANAGLTGGFTPAVAFDP